MSHLPKQDQSTFQGEEETACYTVYDPMTINFQDADLLKQFICPHTGQILEATKTGMFCNFAMKVYYCTSTLLTGLCRQQQKRIVAAIEKALDHGKSHTRRRWLLSASNSGQQDNNVRLTVKCALNKRDLYAEGGASTVKEPR